MKKNNKKIGFAIVGCGRISSRHIYSIKRNNNAELIAICDINEDKLRKVKREHNIKYAYNNIDDLLDNKKIDVVNICTPSGMHPEMIIKCVRKGKDVLCEKPLGLNYKEALNAVKISKKSKRKVIICFQNRYNPPIVYLKKILDNKLLGKVFQITATVRWYRDNSYYSDWHGDKNMGGGILSNQAIHYIDILLYLMNKKPASVYCESKTLAYDIKIDDLATVMINFSDGTSGLVEATNISYPKNMEGSITLQCEKGTIKIGGKALNDIEYWEGKGKPKRKIGSKIENIYGESHFTVIDKFIKMLKGKDRTFSSAEEALLAINLIDKAYESAKKGKRLRIK